MLVLSRKTGEQIRIGQDIVLTVVAVKGKRVRIGIEAPSRCSILREEVSWPAAELSSVDAELELTHS